MTLVSAIEGEGCIVISSDSRAMFGDPRGATATNDTVDKTFKLSDHCGIAVFGAAEIGAKLIDELLNKLQDNPIEEASGLLEFIRAGIRERYNEWFQSFPIEKRPALGFLLAGYDLNKDTNKFDVPRIYTLIKDTDFAPNLHTMGFGMGGSPFFATYILNRVYKKDMPEKTICDLSAYIITETSTQDPKVGGPIKMVVITPKGFGERSKEDIEQIIKRNEQRSENLNSMFFKEFINKPKKEKK